MSHVQSSATVDLMRTTTPHLLKARCSTESSSQQVVDEGYSPQSSTEHGGQGSKNQGDKAKRTLLLKHAKRKMVQRSGMKPITVYTEKSDLKMARHLNRKHMDETDVAHVCLVPNRGRH